MSNKRQLDLHLFRFLPHALRDDFVTVGFLLLEGDGGFAEARFTRDWKMLQCVAPDVELEWFALVETEIRARLTSLRRREDLLQFVSERFGSMIDVAPTKAVLSDDPVKEMELLTGIYLVPLEFGGRTQHRTGRVAIVNRMREAFTNAGVIELMQRNLSFAQYLVEGDPFQIDFGYRVGNAVKMFHAISVATNVDQPLALAYRYSRIDTGMRQQQLQAFLTVLMDQGTALQEEKMQFTIGVLRDNGVRVRPMAQMMEIADEVRRELRA